MVAIVLDALAYKAAGQRLLEDSGLGVLPRRVVAGLLMGFFLHLRCPVHGQIDAGAKALEGGKLSSYTAVVLLQPLGCRLVSNFLWNSIMILPKPFTDWCVAFSP